METWIAIGGFALTVGGVIWRLAISIDRVTQAVKGMASAQGDLSKAKEAQQSELVEQRGQIREHSESLERHESQLAKHETNIDAARRQIAVLVERTKPPKLA